MSMHIEEITTPDGWNEWLITQSSCDILQSWQWGEVKKSELWKAMRVRVVEDGATLVQSQILTRKMPLGMTLYYMPRGPVMDYGQAKSLAALQFLLDWTKEHAAKHKGLMIKLGPAIMAADAPKLTENFAYLGLKPSFRAVQAQYTYLVDLGRPEADILESFDKDTRNLVRRSAREGVVVDRYVSVDDHKELRTFHNLYLAAAEHGKFPPRPWAYFQRLWEMMAPLGMARVYVASYDNKPLAGNMVLGLGDKSYQLWAGSRRDEPKKFATYALQWAAMQDLKADGIKSYDMWGRAPSEDAKHPWAGLSLFKKGFGGQEVEYIGDYDLPLSPTYPLYTTADKLRNKVLG